MIVESMTSLAVGKVRGGKFRNLEKLNLKYWYLFIIGFLLEFGSNFIAAKGNGFLHDFISDYFVFIHSISYILIAIGLVFNFDKKPMMIFFIGHILNFIVIIANNGQMPVSGEGLENLGLLNNLEMLKNQTILSHTLLNESTKFKFLADVIPLPRPYPLPKMISLGDIFLFVGIFMLIQYGMMNRSK